MLFNHKRVKMPVLQKRSHSIVSFFIRSKNQLWKGGVIVVSFYAIIPYIAKLKKYTCESFVMIDVLYVWDEST